MPKKKIENKQNKIFEIDTNYEIIPPKIDFVFKQIFGNEQHKQTLISFLSAVLRQPKEELEGLEIINSELSKSHKKDKKGILDVRVKTKDNKVLLTVPPRGQVTNLPLGGIFLLPFSLKNFT